jgi:hypothetical protein
MIISSKIRIETIKAKLVVFFTGINVINVISNEKDLVITFRLSLNH